MKHEGELWQEYGENGEPLENGGRPSSIGNRVDDEHIYYGGVIIWLYRFHDGNIEVLFQKRSEKVDRFPGKWDCSVGGHVNYGETPVLAGCRELNEEIGVHDLVTEDFEFLMSFKGEIGIYTMFAADYTGHPENFTFDDGEVEKVKWVPLEEYDDFRRKNGKEPLAKDNLTSEFFVRYFEKKLSENGNLDK